MSHEVLGHTADAKFRATGKTLSGAFESATRAFAEIVGAEGLEPTDEVCVEVETPEEDIEALLFDYLDRLIYERDVRSVLPADSEATVYEADGEWVVEAGARGVPLDGVAAREVKAVTYSEMAVEQTVDGWRAYVVLDV